MSGKIFNPKEQLKKFYKFVYNHKLNSMLSADGLIFELDEYIRGEGITEVDGVSIEVIAKMPKGVQEYLFSGIIGREVDLASFSEETQATIAAIAELGHIFRASVNKSYFEKFLKIQGEENSKRKRKGV